MSIPASRVLADQPSSWDGAHDRPDAYIPRDRRRALHAGHALPDRVTGAALFADRR